MSVSERAGIASSFEFEMNTINRAFRKNPFDEISNPEGIVGLSVAHNATISDILVEKLNQEDLRTWDVSMLPYPGDKTGLFRLRKAMAEFLTRQFNTSTKLDPGKFCLVNGVTAGLSLMAHVLCDQGDTILTYSPIYGAIPRNFLCMAGVKTYMAPLRSESFELTTGILESALTEARGKGHRVKALFLINPVNPLGTVYTKDQLLDYLKFCKKHELHCIIDEIYGLSVYDPSVTFTSVLALDPDQLPDKDRTHVLWGLSKDFGMPGNHIGAIYSRNPRVLRALTACVEFQQIPSFSQVSAAKLLEDQEWQDSIYLPTNRKRLAESAKMTMTTLDEIGVPFIKPSAGFFVWIDFRQYLPEATREAERTLCEYFLGKGLALTLSSAFYGTECGWGRMIFAIPRNHLVEGLRRLKEACRSLSIENSCLKK